ncbi:hypothetical protein Y032_0127g1387 [Ancylostoma ceylanicum]|uniref:Uncharacterized protein n=1 Tax=Ancylostoma ceylanicum TaxID=53326 RepID=A0A016T827_9BILA|nr:hypothetical protein Y032_0127g1387 [Ancylostoma ceylanicum]
MCRGVHHHEGKGGVTRRLWIGAFGPQVTPTCLDSKLISAVYGVFVLGAVPVHKEAPVKVAWFHPFSLTMIHSPMYSNHG